jgi:hypothetical protein
VIFANALPLDARLESGRVPVLLAQPAHTPATPQQPQASVGEHKPTHQQPQASVSEHENEHEARHSGLPSCVAASGLKRLMASRSARWANRQN